MFSTRDFLKRLLLSGAAVVASAVPLFLATGCQRIEPPAPDRLNDSPLIVDEAMQIRDWNRSVAYYGNGNTVAGSTRLTFEPKDDDRLNYAADPLIGLGNFVIIPFTYFYTPPFTKVEYQGAIVPPSHFAVPPPAVVR
jgi:hypothetical protein